MNLADHILAVLMVSLRIAPAFAFAPPFTLLRTPASVRLMLALALALSIVAAEPGATAPAALANLPATALGELLLGLTIAIFLQLAFAALSTMGRALDIQVGFGLAQLADPSLRQQMPLVGALFSYAAAAVFFTTSGPADLIAIWSRSLEQVPLGQYAGMTDLGLLGDHMSAMFVLAAGLAGIVFLALFLVDLTIAFMSRTLPQMNVLVLGFQVKTLTLLMTLPFVFSLSGALFLRIVRLAIDNAARAV